MNKIEAHRDCGSKAKQRRRSGARFSSLIGLTMLFGSVMTGQAFSDPGQGGEQGNQADKVTLCHATGSETNPYAVITIDENGLHGHDDHEGDIIPAPAGGCPGPTTTTTAPTVTTAPTTITAPSSTTTAPTITAPTITTTAPITRVGLLSTGGTPGGATVMELTLEPPATVATTPPARVLGATLERPGGSLPRTGSGVTGMATVGLGLLVMGAALKYLSRPTQTPVRPAGS